VDVASFDYELPSARIAQVPLVQRDDARLLVDRGPDVPGASSHVRDLPDLLEPGDLLVVNRTRVLPARLHMRKPTGGAVEVLLLERYVDGTWEALVRGSRRVSSGTRLVVADDGSSDLVVELVDGPGADRRVVRLHAATTELAALDRHGEVPLPPYITATLDDAERYQTVFGVAPESAAAPTAGLHLTHELLARCDARGIDTAFVDLAVGLDTFRPMSADKVEDHVMHGERYSVPSDTWRRCANARSVVAVGTTVVRALESAAATGAREGRTELFIHGDYDFDVVDRLLTNFHLPRSSLLVMIAAFVGPGWRDIYDHALHDDYRFLSFGDAMLLTRRDHWLQA
jgi:S-adenosylmethionine:tRNA ribosyltransferase-isomerase